MEAPWLYDSILILANARACMTLSKAGVNQQVVSIAALTSKQQATSAFCRIMWSLATPFLSHSAMWMKEIHF